MVSIFLLYIYGIRTTRLILINNAQIPLMHDQYVVNYHIIYFHVVARFNN